MKIRIPFSIAVVSLLFREPLRRYVILHRQRERS
jgi:hypothetical protein